MSPAMQRDHGDEIPWPGPRPFTDREEARFFGRESERRDIVRRVDANRITVISARSGVGKTSVLRAGLIPEWCRRRKPEPDGVRRHDLPICVREWWAGVPRTPEEAFTGALSAALGEMVSAESWRARLPEDDLERLERVLATGADSSTNFVSAICNAVGDLVLVLDQFEEILRWAGGTDGNGPLNIVQRMYSREAGGAQRVRLVLSLREEAEPSLRPLERAIGGLARNVYSLVPITPDKARDVIVAPAKGTRWAVRDKPFIDALLGWLGRPGARPGDDEAPVGMLAHVWGEPFAGARLLGLQALLNELAHFAELDDGSLRAPMGCDLMREFLGSGAGDAKIGDDAIEAAIGKAFLGTVDRASSEWMPDLSILPPEIAASPDDDEAKREMIRSLGRRLTALIAPELFNVAGFKIPRRHKELVDRATLLDRRILDPVSEKRKAKAGQLAPQALERVSGVARRYGLGVDATLRFVTAVAGQTLTRLAEHNLFKTFAGGGPESMYELQHDGLGPWLNKWAAVHRGSMDFSTAAVSSLRGESFSWEELKGGTYSHLCWRGCEFEEKTFDGVTFTDCDFSGCYFTNCTFRGAVFHRCLMRGVVIRGGTVQQAGGETEQGLALDQIDARSMLVAGLKVEGRFDIRAAILEGLTVVECTVAGEWRIISSRVMLANFSALRGRSDEEPPIQLIDSDLVLSIFDQDALGTDKKNMQAGNYPQSSLNDAFRWRHREEELLAWIHKPHPPISIPIDAVTLVPSVSAAEPVPA